MPALKQPPSKGLYLMGGAQLTRSLLEAGVVDKLRLIVYPLLAGGGRGLFEGLAPWMPMSLQEVWSTGDGRAEPVYRLAGGPSH